MRGSILLRCFFVLAACGPMDDGVAAMENEQEEEEEEEEGPKACSTVLASTPGFTRVSGDFFRAADGALYVKTRFLAENGDSTGPEVFRRTPVHDAASYRRLGDEEWYATDGMAVYTHQDTTVGTVIGLVEGADPATFESTGYRTGRDATHRYDNGRIAP